VHSQGWQIFGTWGFRQELIVWTERVEDFGRKITTLGIVIRD